MPRTTPRQRLEAREAAILRAAGEVFGEHGFDSARMADIARRADVAEGTLYLYHRNKRDLLEAVVADFWANLTEGARETIAAGVEPLWQLEQLASYHLTALVNNIRIVEFTYRAVREDPASGAGLAPVRDYVRVFDEIIARATELGELHTDAPLWQLRDLFYGTLEFSARTLVLHGRPADKTVVDNLLSVFRLSYSSTASRPTARPITGSDAISPEPRTPPQQSGLEGVLAALTRIEDKLDRRR